MRFKRCKPVTLDIYTTGCGDTLPISEYRYQDRADLDGKVIRKYVSWCNECQRKRERAKSARSRAVEYNKRQKLIHNKETCMQKLFLRTLAPTDVIRERRYVSV